MHVAAQGRKGAGDGFGGCIPDGPQNLTHPWSPFHGAISKKMVSLCKIPSANAPKHASLKLSLFQAVVSACVNEDFSSHDLGRGNKNRVEYLPTPSG